MKKWFLIVIVVLMMRSSYGAYEAPYNTDKYTKYSTKCVVDENGTSWTAIKWQYRSAVSGDWYWTSYSLGNASSDGKYLPAVSGTIPDELVIPSKMGDESICTMEPAAFQNLLVKSVVISEGFKDISYGAFRGCANLTTISFPSTLTTIAAYAFSCCESLNVITIPTGVTSIGTGAFVESNLKSIEISETVTSVGTDAFANLHFDEFHVVSSPKGWSKKAFGHCSTLNTAFIKTFRCPSECLEAWLKFFDSASITPLKVETELSTVKVLSTLNCGGTLSFRNKQLVKGETASITATPNDGYVFLGWSSDVEGIGGSEPTLTFTVPERDEVLLIANFFPKAVLATLVNETLNATLDEKVDARIEAKIDGESLLTAEQAATKTSATIEAKVADGELITSDQLQVMAMEVPVIAVEDGVAKVGVSLKRAESLNGEWTQVEAEEAEITEDGDISVSVPADEKAAFYKFVVPNQQ